MCASRAIAFALAFSCTCACTAAAAAEPQPPQKIASVTITGRTFEPVDRLARFLGLVAGAPFDPDLPARVQDILTRQLGYVVKAGEFATTPKGVAVTLDLEPRKVVRHVDVHGNWPVFNDDIRRRLTLRPGSSLPPETELPALLAQESARVREFLRRDGWFGADVDVVVRPAGRPEWVDLDVLVYLGNYARLGDVLPSYSEAELRDGRRAPAVSHDELTREFRSAKPFFFGRFRIDQMREDARSVEQTYRERDFPAARVIPEFDPEVDLKNRTARVRARITEKVKVNLRFVGNHALTEKELHEKVTIFTAGSYDEVELQESARELFRLYQSHGFLEARVACRKQRDADGGSLTVTCIVDEGPELKVRTVDLAPEPGDPPLAADRDALRGLLATKVFPAIGALGLGEGGYVTNLQLQQDAEKIVAWYRQNGWPEARARGEIARDPPAFDNVGALSADVASGWGHGMDLYVRFAIHEGRHESVGRLAFRFRGAHGDHERDLAAEARLAPGTPYTRDALKVAVKRVIDYYSRRGHPYISIDNPIGEAWNADHTRVDLTLTVDEGPEVRFGEILVRGNFKTAEAVIRSDLPFERGDLFDRDKLARAERNLQTHAIFNGVSVKPIGLTASVNPVPVLVEIQERYDDWGTPILAAGYATDTNGPLFSLGYFWGNVFGGGGSFELRGDIALDVTQWTGADQLFTLSNPFWRLLSLTLRYVHPHLGIPSLRGEVQANARKENTIRLGEVDAAALSLSLSWIASPSFRIFGRYDVSISQLQNIDLQRLPGRNDSLSAVRDSTTDGKLTLGAVWDDRLSFDGAKNPLMPVEGWLVAATATLAARPFAFEAEHSHNFLVFSGQVQRYQPLGRGITLIANLRGDWGIPLGEPALPAVERFFGGGDTATRGFDTDKLKTEIIRGDVSPAPGGAAFRIIPQGGNIRFLGTLELQFPVSHLGSFPLVGAIFVDAGSIFDQPALFDASRDVKVAVGLTLLRILTPVGPLSLEYAYPLTQTLAEEQWKKEPWYLHWPGRIHFNWGIPILR